MSEPLLECRLGENRWIWSGKLLGKKAADRLAEKVFETWQKLNAMWPDMPQNVDRMVVPAKDELRIVLTKPPRRLPWGDDTIGIVNGFDVTVTAGTETRSSEAGVYTETQRVAYGALYGQWHVRRGIDVAHVGGHRMKFVPSTEPATHLDMEMASRAAGNLYDARDPDLWLEVTRAREQDRDDEIKLPARRPDFLQIERDILAARAFLPSVETVLSNKESLRFMERIKTRLAFGAHHAARIIEVARSIAALDKERTIGPAHLAEAVQYAPPEWRGRKNPGDDDDFWSKPISVYTRAQAIEDGVLVDLSAIVPDVCRQHYKYPIACTAAVWAIIDAAVRNKHHMNSVAGIVHDILWMSRVYKRQISPDTVITRVTITGAGRKKIYDLKLVAGPGDNAEPVITLMLPEED